MAKKSASKTGKKRPPLRRRRQSGNSNAGGVLFVIGLIGLGLFKPNVAILIAMGLLPTIVLGFTGKGDNKTRRTMSVGFANAAGILVLIGDVWSNSSAFNNMIVDVNNWIVMWGSAAIGYALNYVGPMIAAMVLQGLAQDRIKNITQEKQELVELWGHEVLGSKDDDKPDLGMSTRRPAR